MACGLNLVVRNVQHNVFLAFGVLVRVEAEQQLVQNLAFFGGKILVSNQNGFRFHHHFNLFQVVAHQRASRADNVENAVGQADTGGNLNRAGNHVDFGLYSVLVKETLQNAGVRSGNLLAVEPLKSFVVNLFRNGQRQTALAEIQSLNNLRILLTLLVLVFANNAHIGNAASHGLRNVIVTQIKNLYREILCRHQQGALSRFHLNARLCKHCHCLVKQTAFGLNCNS